MLPNLEKKRLVSVGWYAAVMARDSSSPPLLVRSGELNRCGLVMGKF